MKRHPRTCIPNVFHEKNKSMKKTKQTNKTPINLTMLTSRGILQREMPKQEKLIT